MDYNLTCEPYPWEIWGDLVIVANNEGTFDVMYGESIIIENSKMLSIADIFNLFFDYMQENATTVEIERADNLHQQDKPHVSLVIPSRILEATIKFANEYKRKKKR